MTLIFNYNEWLIWEFKVPGDKVPSGDNGLGGYGPAALPNNFIFETDKCKKSKNQCNFSLGWIQPLILTKSLVFALDFFKRPEKRFCGDHCG